MSAIGAVLLLTSVVILLTGLPLWLEKVPPNWFYGFRTPRTVNNEEIWYPVNAIAGRDLTLAGALAAIAVVLADWWLVDPIQGALVLTAAAAIPMTLAIAHSFWAASAWVAAHDAKTTDPVPEKVSERPRTAARSRESES